MPPAGVAGIVSRAWGLWPMRISWRIVDRSVYTFRASGYDARMEPSATSVIVESLTRAIALHRLQPGAKLAEQKLADHFGVSRTLVRQALFQMAQNRLVQM